MNPTFDTSLLPPYDYPLDSSSGQRPCFAYQSVSVHLCIHLSEALAGVLSPVCLQQHVVLGWSSPIITRWALRVVNSYLWSLQCTVSLQDRWRWREKEKVSFIDLNQYVERQCLQQYLLLHKSLFLEDLTIIATAYEHKPNIPQLGLSSPILPLPPSTDLPWSAVGEGDAFPSLLVKIWLVRTALWVASWKVQVNEAFLVCFTQSRKTLSDADLIPNWMWSQYECSLYYQLVFLILFPSLPEVLINSFCQQINILCRFRLNNLLSLPRFKGNRQTMPWMAPSQRALAQARHGWWVSGAPGAAFQQPWCLRHLKPDW